VWGASGVPVWSIIEPFTLGFSLEIPTGACRIRDPKTKRKLLEIQGKQLLTQAEFEREVHRLTVFENKSIREVCHLLKCTQTPIRLYCRTHRIGPYQPLKEGQIPCRSSQEPYGWRREGSGLSRKPSEMVWVKEMLEMRVDGISYKKISAFLNEQGVLTKQDKEWDPRTGRRIIEFNRNNSLYF